MVSPKPQVKAILDEQEANNKKTTLETQKALFHLKEATKCVQTVQDVSVASSSLCSRALVELGEKTIEQRYEEVRSGDKKRPELVKDIKALLVEKGIQEHDIHTKGPNSVLIKIKSELEGNNVDFVSDMSKLQEYVAEADIEYKAIYKDKYNDKYKHKGGCRRDGKLARASCSHRQGAQDPKRLYWLYWLWWGEKEERGCSSTGHGGEAA